MVEPMRAILLRQSCWAAGQCRAQRPVMCGAGLTVWARGGSVGDGVRQRRALGSFRPGAAAACAGLLRGFGDVDLEICSD